MSYINYFRSFVARKAKQHRTLDGYNTLARTVGLNDV